MKLSTRLAVAMVALAVLTAAAVGFITYRDVELAILSSEIERQKANIHLVALDFELRMRAARADIIGFRAAVALAGIVRAAENGGTDPVDGTTLAEWNRTFRASPCRRTGRQTQLPSVSRHRRGERRP